MTNPVVNIEPHRGFDAASLAELFTSRELLYFLVWRDLKVRYRQTLLGVFWVVLQPLLIMALYSIIFGSFVKLPQGGHYPYALFVLAGVIPWNYVSSAITDSSNSLLGNAHLIGKVYFPRIYLPLARILVLLSDCAISTLLLLVIALGLGAPVTGALLLVPVAVLLCTSLSLGLGALFTALNVRYRDFYYIVPFGLQVWMFCTPIIYPAQAIPARYRWIVDLNPMTGIVDLYRAAFLGEGLHLVSLVYATCVVAIILAGGVYYFSRAEHRFVDLI